ncbi:MAG TPA: hypothetical protein VGL56_15935 [Fimbriimonadaceae bacterium]|jgi:hypothetical protein
MVAILALLVASTLGKQMSATEDVAGKVLGTAEEVKFLCYAVKSCPDNLPILVGDGMDNRVYSQLRGVDPRIGRYTEGEKRRCWELTLWDDVLFDGSHLVRCDLSLEVGGTGTDGKAFYELKRKGRKAKPRILASGPLPIKYEIEIYKTLIAQEEKSELLFIGARPAVMTALRKETSTIRDDKTFIDQNSYDKTGYAQIGVGEAVWLSKTKALVEFDRYHRTPGNDTTTFWTALLKVWWKGGKLHQEQASFGGGE